MIYAAERKSDGIIKIGYSETPWRRVINMHPPHRLLACWPGNHVDERAAHRELHAFNSNREWSGRKWSADQRLNSGPREWFLPTEEVLLFVASQTIAEDEPRSAASTGRKSPSPALLGYLGYERVEQRYRRKK